MHYFKELNLEMERINKSRKESEPELFIPSDKFHRGIGKFAVHALAEEARQRGFDRLTVIWESGEEGPGEFFRRIGFTEVGETEYGEKIGELTV